MTVLRLALAQTSFTPRSLDGAFAETARLAAAAAQHGASLLMLPEAFLSGYGDAAAARALALEATEARAALAPIAAENGIAILAGYSERAGDDLFNSAILVSSDGLLRLNYRKMHLWGDFERAVYRPGEPSAIVALAAGLRAGVLVCFDLDFGAASQDLVRRGADVILVLSATSFPYSVVPRHVVPARAYENAAFVAFCNRVGDHHGARFIGLSCAAAPDGSMVAEGPADAEALVIADIDPDRFRAYVAEHRYHPHQRADIFPLRSLREER